MIEQAQNIFRVIVLHNKLCSEAQVDMYFAEEPEPELIVGRMIKDGFISPEKAHKLIALYRANLEKKGAGKPGAATATAPPPMPPPAPAEARRVESPPPPAHADVRVGATRSGGADMSVAGRELIHSLLKGARKAGASDLHLKAGSPPIIRYCAGLKDLQPEVMDPEVCRQSLFSLLNETQIERFEKTHDLDFCYDAGPELGRYRTNYLMEHRGMKGVFRLINSKVPSFEELKLPEQIRKFTTYRQGIVLITGPKSSGKTTTLAALVDMINANRPEHIITIEDPIEFVHPCKKGHVNQREVGPHTETFSNALRAALREAPDVIMVGEMRDLETTSLAITAAETGHLVFATLHTPDAARTIGRVLDVFPPKEQGQIRAMFSESLRGIVSQLLIPGVDGHTMHLATEILFNTSAIGNLIRDNRAFQLKGVMQTGKKLGMQLMDESLVKLVREKKITKEDAVVRAENPPLMEKDLAGF